jgi:hypothetical protein
VSLYERVDLEWKQMKTNSSRNVVVILTVTALTISMVIAPLTAKASLEDNDPKDPLKHSQDDGTDSVTSARQGVTPELNYEDTKLLGSYFGWPERLIAERFGQAMPAALKTSIVDTQGAALAKVFAELYATQSRQDVKSLVARAELLKAEREKKDGDTQVNSASNHMLERMVDAGKWLLSEKSGKNTPPRHEFLGWFEQEWEERMKKNEEVIAYRDKAIDPNNTDEGRKQAKEWLRENVNRDQVMAFIDKQIKNGNETEAAKWFKAMAWKEGDQYFADFRNNGKDIRFYAGKSDNEIAKSLAGYEGKSSENAGLLGITFNKAQTTAEALELYGTDGKIKEGRPDGVGLPSWLTPGANPPSNDTGPAPTLGKAAYQKYCSGCHTDAAMRASSEIAAMRVQKKKDMPPQRGRNQPSSSERDAIAAFVRTI